MKNTLLALLLPVLLVAEASACSCLPKTLEQFAQDADAIYFATLQEAKLVERDGIHGSSIEGQFRIRQTLKGHAPSKLVRLTTPADSATCGVIMIVAATHILFMDKGSTSVIACDGSHAIERFQEAEYAAKVKAALKKGSRK